MEEVLAGTVYRVGDNVTAYDIVPQRYKSSDKLDSAELATRVFADFDPGFGENARAGAFQVVVAGRNFGGGGKSIEGPVWALKGAGIRLVVADSFARYFLRNAINNALPAIVCPGISAAVKTGDRLEVDMGTARVTNLITGVQLYGNPLSATAIKIIGEGGLVAYTRKRLAESDWFCSATSSKGEEVTE